MLTESGYVSCLFVKWGPRTDTGVCKKHTVFSERFSQGHHMPLSCVSQCCIQASGGRDAPGTQKGRLNISFIKMRMDVSGRLVSPEEGLTSWASLPGKTELP